MTMALACARCSGRGSSHSVSAYSYWRSRYYFTVQKQRTETILTDDDAIRDTYRTVFGLELDRLPALGNRDDPANFPLG